jgi:hypothetical protein
LTVNVGQGGKGGDPGLIDGTLGEHSITTYGDSYVDWSIPAWVTPEYYSALSYPSNGEPGKPSFILRGGTRILSTCGSADTNTVECGGMGGLTTGLRASGDMSVYTIGNGTTTAPTAAQRTGFSSTSSTGARSTGGGGCTSNCTSSTHPWGGNGGNVITPWFSCNHGGGAVDARGSGSDIASNHGGCGGGGGRSFGKGGAGSMGYARIVYNPSEHGLGAGGSSGFTISEYRIAVTPGQVIPYRIGAGGLGGGRIDGTVMAAGRAGGNTSFGTGATGIIAGGGPGGGSPTISGANVTRGTAGNLPGTCSILGVNNVNNALCINAERGFQAAANNSATAGAGGNSSQGAGGLAGNTNDSFEEARGKMPGGIAYGAGGGGGAVVRYMATNFNPSIPHGGNGQNGMILVQWRGRI